MCFCANFYGIFRDYIVAENHDLSLLENFRKITERDEKKKLKKCGMMHVCNVVSCPFLLEMFQFCEA
jgi:hypothetical protein